MAVTNMNCDKASKIKEFCRIYGNEPFTFDKCFLTQVMEVNGRQLLINNDSLLSKYKRELMQYRDQMTLDTSQYIKYRFNPKRFAYDIYGTTELWFAVLHANELYTVNQFDLERVFYYTPNAFVAITRMLDLEIPFTNINEAEVDELLTKFQGVS